MRRELPQEWQDLATRAGVRPSFTGIAEASGLAITTVQRLVLEGRSLQGTVETVAEALRVPADDVRRMAGIGDGTFWYPPDEAQNLSPAVQDALDRLILAIARDQESAGEKLRAPLYRVPGWAVEEAARTGDRAIDRELPGDEDLSQDPDDWQ